MNDDKFPYKTKKSSELFMKLQTENHVERGERRAQRGQCEL